MAAGSDIQAHGLGHRLLVADSFFKRFVGLMGRRTFPDADGVVLLRTRSVHTFFMRMPMDLVYLNGSGVVTATRRRMPPWRVSIGPRDTEHVVELPAGAIERSGLAVGDTVALPPALKTPAAHSQAERGASLVEFAIVAPVISLMGLGVIQYGMLFFAKNNINHAAFMAARAGATEHADLGKVGDAYIGALTPMYANGRSEPELVEARAKAEANMAGHVRIELLNPTKESFDDWNDPALQQRLGTGTRRVIPNSGLAFKPVQVKQASGQTLQDANLIKLRITHGFEPKVPLISGIYKWSLSKLDPKVDAFHTSLVSAGRIPVMTHVTLHMQSDPIEPASPVSLPGMGNGGNPVNPGDPPVSTDPLPPCTTAGCTVPDIPPPPGCDARTDPNGCLPPTCSPFDPKCDPDCGVIKCCTGRQG